MNVILYKGHLILFKLDSKGRIHNNNNNNNNNIMDEWEDGQARKILEDELQILSLCFLSNNNNNTTGSITTTTTTITNDTNKGLISRIRKNNKRKLKDTNVILDNINNTLPFIILFEDHLQQRHICCYRVDYKHMN